MVEVERPHHPVRPWCPAGVRRVPFGDAVFLFSVSSFGILCRVEERMKTRKTHGTRGLASVPGSRYFSRISPNGART